MAHQFLISNRSLYSNHAINTYACNVIIDDHGLAPNSAAGGVAVYPRQPKLINTGHVNFDLVSGCIINNTLRSFYQIIAYCDVYIH